MNLALKEVRDLLQTHLGAGFNRYYVGKVSAPPADYLPVLMVHGAETTQTQVNGSTSKDHWTFKIEITIIENVYNYITTDGVESDLVLKTQQAVRNKMEERNTNGSPKSTSVLGVLRQHILGTNYLFNHNVSIRYEEFLQSGTVYFKGTMTIELEQYAPRS